MRGFLIAVGAFLLLLEPVAAQQSGGATLIIDLSDRIRVSERSNLLRTENGRYVGLENSQITAYLTRTREIDEGSLYAGTGLRFAETLRDMNQVGRPVDRSFESIAMVSPRGGFVQSSGVPRYLGIPTLPETPVSVGDTWTAPALLLVPTPRGTTLSVPTDVAYEFAGQDQFDGEPVYRINARFASRYPRPRDTAEDAPPFVPDEEIHRISGAHTLTILIPASGQTPRGAPLFIRDELEQSIALSDGLQINLRGHRLLFVYGFSAVEQESMAAELQESLADQAARDVLVETTDTGTRLTLQKIRFVPDEATILPDEVGRLDQIAAALATLEGVRFLVVGHTADIGSAESQQVLSLERAQVIVAELVRRGLERHRFDLEGRGGEQPVGSNTTESGRALNRRVEIYVLEE